MYKVLIVDDEVLVRVGLKNTIDWESIGFTVIGEASNGEHGYSQFHTLEPDVVITDIKMPKKDGLWLTEKIHQEKKSVKIVVLTCYDEFQYARNALKSGASDYMLKSEIVDDELIELMKRLKKSLDDERQHEKPQANQAVNQKVIKRALLNDLIKVGFTLDERLLRRVKEQRLMDEGTKYAFIYFENAIKERNNAKQISETTVNLFIDQLNERELKYLFNGYMDEHLFLIASETLSLNQLKRISDTVSNGLKQYFGLSINLIYTDPIGSFDGLESLHKELITAGDVFFFIEDSKTFISNLGHIKWQHVETRELRKPLSNQLIESVGKEDFDGAVAIFDELIGTFKDNHYEPKALKMLMNQTVAELYSVFQYVFDNAFNYTSFHDDILMCKHQNQLRQLFVDFLSQLVNELKYIRRNQSNYLIKRAINFIEHNYDQNISLEDVAKVISLSKQYVCHIFKRETGKNLSHYINEVRIEKAKQLLLNPSYTNKDIYAMVGFSNQQYFSRVFKKVTGMTTSEYKERHYKHNHEV